MWDIWNIYTNQMWEFLLEEFAMYQSHNSYEITYTLFG